MKKIILTICMLLIPLMLFADLPTPTGVTVKVSGTRDDSGTFDIGFSSNVIGQWSVLPIHIQGDSIPLNTKFLPDGSVIGELPYGLLNVYWRVVTRKSIILSLALDGPMKNGTSTLNWTASWTYDGNTVTLDSATDTSETYKTLHICQELINVESIGGSAPITVKTDKLEGKLATNSYTGNLKLKIELKK